MYHKCILNVLFYVLCLVSTCSPRSEVYLCLMKCAMLLLMSEKTREKKKNDQNCITYSYSLTPELFVAMVNNNSDYNLVYLKLSTRT